MKENNNIPPKNNELNSVERERLVEFFINLQNNKKDFVKASRGKEFETNIAISLKKFTFSQIIGDKKLVIQKLREIEINISKKECKDKWLKLKEQCLNKENLEIIDNPFNNIRSHFIFQPYGSQQFPDFLIFCGNKIYLIEVKFSWKQGMPFWNSNLPKSSCIYIFGRASQNLTFFKGVDFLGDETRKILNDFFSKIDNKDLLKKLKEILKSNQLDKKIDENVFGLKPYIRKAFDYNNDFKTDATINDYNFFNIERTKLWEKNVIELIREKNNE